MYHPTRPYATLCNLWERREHTGQLYLSGRNGSNMYIVTRLPQTDLGGPQWALLLAETPATQQAGNSDIVAAAASAEVV